MNRSFVGWIPEAKRESKRDGTVNSDSDISGYAALFIERLWKTVKYEEIYLKAYESISHARKELTKFFDRYNMRRPHPGFHDMTPDEVYWSTLAKIKDAV